MEEKLHSLYLWLTLEQASSTTNIPERVFSIQWSDSRRLVSPNTNVCISDGHTFFSLPVAFHACQKCQRAFLGPLTGYCIEANFNGLLALSLWDRGLK